MRYSGILGWIALLVFPVLLAGAGDDVYDEASPKKIKVKPAPAPAETPVSSPSVSPAPASFGNDRYEPGTYEEEDYGNVGFNSYSERIRRFHQPSVGFNASFGGYYGGYGGYNNNFYDPWAWNSGWNNTGWSQNYWFTPRPYWDYYNYWNPFNTTVIVINRPWQLNWGWGYDPWSPFGWNNYWQNSWNNPWYNPWNNWWTPNCHNIVYNNWGWDYGYNRRNVVYGPRTGTNTNSPNYGGPQKSPNNGGNYQYNFNSGKNNGTTINKQQKTIEPVQYDRDNNNSNYKPKPTYTPSQQQQPSGPPRNDYGTKDTDSGIKVIKKQK